jgi:hypothetical protein
MSRPYTYEYLNIHIIHIHIHIHIHARLTVPRSTHAQGTSQNTPAANLLVLWLLPTMVWYWYGSTKYQTPHHTTQPRQRRRNPSSLTFLVRVLLNPSSLTTHDETRQHQFLFLSRPISTQREYFRNPQEYRIFLQYRWIRRFNSISYLENINTVAVWCVEGADFDSCPNGRLTQDYN